MRRTTAAEMPAARGGDIFMREKSTPDRADVQEPPLRLRAGTLTYRPESDRESDQGRRNQGRALHLNYKTIEMGLNKKIALVAHDNKKRDLLEWATFNRDLLAHHGVFATGTTGAALEKELKFPIKRLESGPLGGDQQIGSKIVDGDIDFLIFFWDPLEPQPHDPH